MLRSDGLRVLGRRVAKHSSRLKPHRCNESAKAESCRVFRMVWSHWCVGKHSVAFRNGGRIGWRQFLVGQGLGERRYYQRH